MTILALLHRAGLRPGELARLDVASWDRGTARLRIDGRRTGRERQVPGRAVTLVGGESAL